MKKIFSTSLFLLLVYFVSATNWLVGSLQIYTLPSQVSSLVQDGDTVSINSGIYASDVAQWTANNLLLRGVGGYAHLKSNGLSWGGKAIWVIGGNNNRVESIEFSECACISQNGAGIRQEGLNLTVSHCYFHDNEEGILAGTLNPSKIIVEFCEFAYNGFGTGYSHNLYINNIDTLIFQFNYSHHAFIGHELKSRAHVNYILYNRFSNEATGNASREIDLPNGGTSYLIGNVIEQGPNSTNSGIIGFGLEGLINPFPQELYMINNTIVNEKQNGIFVDVQPGTDFYKAYNNIFAGGGNSLNGTANILDTSNNIRVTNIASVGFANATNYDYHLTSGSMAINAGAFSGNSNNGFVLTPFYEYVHKTDSVNRNIFGIIDAGAYEYFSPSAINEISVLKKNFQYWFANGSLTCTTSLQSVSIKIFSANGKLVIAKKLLPGISLIDLINYPCGTYLIEVMCEREIISGKFEKLR